MEPLGIWNPDPILFKIDDLNLWPSSRLKSKLPYPIEENSLKIIPCIRKQAKKPYSIQWNAPVYVTYPPPQGSIEKGIYS
jgi:hypothetical protein